MLYYLIYLYDGYLYLFIYACFYLYWRPNKNQSIKILYVPLPDKNIIKVPGDSSDVVGV